MGLGDCKRKPISTPERDSGAAAGVQSTSRGNTVRSRTASRSRSYPPAQWATLWKVGEERSRRQLNLRCAGTAQFVCSACGMYRDVRASLESERGRTRRACRRAIRSGVLTSPTCPCRMTIVVGASKGAQGQGLLLAGRHGQVAEPVQAGCGHGGGRQRHRELVQRGANNAAQIVQRDIMPWLGQFRRGAVMAIDSWLDFGGKLADASGERMRCRGALRSEATDEPALQTLDHSGLSVILTTRP